MGKGIYCYNEKSKRLEMWQGLGKRFQSIVSQAAMFELNPADNSIYFSTDVARIFNGRIYRTPKGDTIVDYKALKRIPDLNFYPGLAYCVDDDGSVWMGGTRGLAKYNPANDTRNYELDFTCLIRRITYGKDSVLFGGGLAATEIGQRKTNFDYNFNSLTLHYAAPFFDQEEATQYSYRLEGRDKNWSAWSHQPFKEYSDLPEGDYTFSVKAQNVYGKESSIASFSFAVQPPIYRTWWAYLIYISGFMVLIFGVVQWRTRALNKRKKELEELVKVRTNELVSMNQELEASQEELKQNNDELLATNEHLVETQKQLVESEKMASLGQLTAGIAHEINNPINFISGGVQALEILQNELLDGKTLTPDEVQTRQDINDLLKSINNGVSRTADIVKSLKTFSSGSKEFDKQTDVKYAIESAVVLVNSKIIENRISLNKDFQHTSYVTANSPQISQVIINLLDNSIYALRKKTGERIISIRTIEAEKEVIIKVKDNGEGIPDEARNHVFEPFFTTKEVGSGTGLGMSICYSIIKNHKGKISFESSPNEGTEFTIALPKN
jgi:signal transduction histidine kinase